MRKIRLSFIVETDLRYGGGTEKTILYYNKYFNKNIFEINLFQTNIIDKERLSLEEIREIYQVDKLFTFFYPNILKSLLSDKEKGLSYQGRKISKDLFLIYSIFLKYLFSRTVNRRTFRNLMSSDVIYVLSDYQLFYLFFPTKLISNKKPLLIFGTHNYLPIERRFLNRFENAILSRMVAAIHFTSPAIYSVSSIKKDSSFIVSNGVDTSIFYPENEEHRVIRFLFVGRLVEYKGIVELIHAWSRFRFRDNAELHIVGTGEFESFVREKSKEINNIIHHGFVSEAELPKIYRECDVLVFPTYGIRHDEYFGLVVIEALASGLYVILGDGMKGVFDYFEERGALEYCPVDPEKLAQRMENAMENLSTLKRNVMDVRSYIEENYDWKGISENLSRKIYEIYSKLT